MAAKKNTDKKISINKLDALLAVEKAQYGETRLSYDIDGETVDILVKHSISFAEMQAFAENVAENMFIDDESTGEVVYAPALYQPAWVLNFVAYFTNLKVEIGAERAMDLSYATDLLPKMMEVADREQLRDIQIAIKEAVEFRKQTLLSGERIRLNYIIEQLDKAMPALEQNASLLADMSPEDLTKAVQAMGNMDEGKLAKAVLKEQEVYAPLQPGEMVAHNNVVEMPKPKKTSTRKKKTEE